MKSIFDNRHEAEMIDRLKSLEINPPKGSWDDIQNTLKLRRRKSIVIFTSLASAATVALFFTIAGVHFIANTNSTNQNIIAVSQSNSEKNEVVNIKPSIINTENIVSTSKRNFISSKVVDVESNKTLELPKEVLRNSDVPDLIQPIQKPLKSNTQSQKRISNPINTNRYCSNLIPESKKERKRKGEWFISASGFPVYSYHTAGIIKKDGTQNESGMMSWGGSISIIYSFSNSISFESGITYSKVGEQEKNLYIAGTNLRGPAIVTNGASTTYGNLTLNDDNYRLLDEEDVNTIHTLIATNYTKVRGSQQFKYIEIPILLAKRFYFRGYKFNLKGGISESILIGNMLELDGDKVNLSGKTANMDTYSTSAIAAISLSIPMFSKVNLLIEPNVKFGLKPLSTSYGKSYPFASYIKFGVEVPL